MFTAKRKGLLVFLAALFIAALIGVGIIFAPASARPASAAEEGTATEVSSVQELMDAVNDKEIPQIKLTTDITFDYTSNEQVYFIQGQGYSLKDAMDLIYGQAGVDISHKYRLFVSRDLVLDLGTHTLTVITDDTESAAVIYNNNGGVKVTIKNGKLVGQSAGNFANIGTRGDGNSNVTLQDVDVEFTHTGNAYPLSDASRAAAIFVAGKLKIDNVSFLLKDGTEQITNDKVLPVIKADIPQGYVTYATLQDEVNAAGTAATLVTLTKDYTENITISKGQNITLDLDGHKIEVQAEGEYTSSAPLAAITNNGVLTIKDSSEGETGFVNAKADPSVTASTKKYVYAVLNNSDAALTINSGKFNSEDKYCICSSGTLTISGGSFNADSSYAIYCKDSCSLTVTGGIFSGKYGFYFGSSNATAKISNATVNATDTGMQMGGSSTENATATVTDCKINVSADNAAIKGIVVWSIDLTIDDTQINVEELTTNKRNATGIILNKNADVTVKGDTSINVYGAGNENQIFNSSSSYAFIDLTIDNVKATFNKVGSSIENAGENMLFKMNGKKDNTSPITINGGDFSGGTVGIYSNVKLLVNGGKFEADLKGSGTINIAGGTFVSENITEWFDSAWLVNGEDRYVLHSTNAEKTYEVKQFKQEDVNDPTAIFIGGYVASVNGENFESLTEALTKAGEANGTLKLLADVEESLTISQTLTLDLNGRDITVADGAVIAVNDGATLTVTGSGKVIGQIDVQQGGNIVLEGGTYSEKIDLDWIAEGYALSYDSSEYSISDNQAISLVRNEKTYYFANLSALFVGDIIEGGETVVLLKDVGSTTLGSGKNGKVYTIDMNGHNMSGTTNIYAGTLNIVNNGSVVSNITSSGRIFQIMPEGTNVAELTLGENINVTAGTEAVFIQTQITNEKLPADLGDLEPVAILHSSANITANGGFAIVANGNGHGTKIVIDGGSVKTTADAPAIYHPQYGTLTIKGGANIEGATGVEIRNGILNVENATITATAKSFETTVTPSGGGSTVTGAAIAVTKYSNSKVPLVVNVGSATLDSEAENGKALYEGYPDAEGSALPDGNTVEMTVNGATLNAPVQSVNKVQFIQRATFAQNAFEEGTENYLAKSNDAGEAVIYYPVKDGGYGVGTVEDAMNDGADTANGNIAFNGTLMTMEKAIAAGAVAIIGSATETTDIITAYATLTEAVAAANNGETVALVKDITISSGSAVKYSAGSPLDKELTIDLAGNKITSIAEDHVFDISTTKDFTITSSVDGGTINAAAALQLKSNKVKETKDAGAEIATVNFNVSKVKFTGKYASKNPLLFENKYPSSVQLNVILDGIIVEYESDNGNATFKVIENINYSNLEIKDSKITVTDNSKSRKKGAPFYAVYNSSYNYGGEFSISNSTITTDGRKGMPTQYGLGGPVASIGVDLTVTNSTISSADGPGITFYGSMITEQALAAGAEKDYKTLTISGGDITGYTFALSGNGDGSYEGTNITVKDGAKLTATIGAGIYQPQVGILNIEGKGTSVTGSSGIEIRAGKLNVKDAAITATAEKFSVIANGGGTTTDGAAIVVAQHSKRAEKWLPISVNLESGTYKGLKAVYQADVLQNGDEAVKEIEMALIGGEYNGAIESQNVTGFIAGGTFSQAVDESYMATGFALEEYNGTYIVVKEEPEVAPTIAERVNAQSEVRAYMAAFGLKLSDMQALAGEDGKAAAIVDAYDSLMGAGTATLLAEAKLAAMDAVDAFIDALNAAKADAVEQIVEYAANAEEGIVTVPTYVLSAINGAASAAEVQTYLEAAKAEIDEVRAQRAAAEVQANALAEKVAGIIEALKITESEEGAWSTTLLNEVMEQLNVANTDIDSILGLIGQPAEGDKNNTIFDMIKDVDGDIATAVKTITKHIDDKVAEFTGEITAIKTGVEALNELFNGAEGTEGLAQTIEDIEGYVTGIQGSIGNLAEGQTLASVLGEIEKTQDELKKAVESYKTAVDNALSNISDKFDDISAKIEALPEYDEQFKTLTEAVSKVQTAVDYANDSLGSLSDNADSIKTTVEDMQTVQNSMNEAFKEFENTFATAMQTLGGRFDAVDKAVAALDTAIGALPDNTQAIAELKTALAEAQKGITAANEGIAQLGTDLGTVEDKVDVIDSTADSVLAAQNALKTAVEGYKAAADEALADISESLAALDKDLAVLTASTAADKEALSKEIAALQTTANKLEDAVAALDGDSQADLTAITEDLAGLQTSLDGLKADIQKVAQSVTAVEEDSVNSASGFAGLYVFISALVVLVVAVLVVVSLKKRA